MTADAERRIASAPTRYVHHVYGKDEVGGTCVLHLSSVSFERLGYPSNLPKRPMGTFTYWAMKAIPSVVVALVLVLGGITAIVRRRMRLTGERKEERHEA